LAYLENFLIFVSYWRKFRGFPKVAFPLPRRHIFVHCFVIDETVLALQGRYAIEEHMKMRVCVTGNANFGTLWT
jgi:hypothetical protein